MMTLHLLNFLPVKAIYPGHIPLTAVVVPCVLSIHNGNDVKKAAVHGGIIEILKDKITILAEVAEWSDEIDVERANEARLRAEKRLASHDSDLDMVRAEAALKRSLARIICINLPLSGNISGDGRFFIW
mgnify:CR=1 FL=1